MHMSKGKKCVSISLSSTSLSLGGDKGRAGTRQLEFQSEMLANAEIGAGKSEIKRRK